MNNIFNRILSKFYSSVGSVPKPKAPKVTKLHTLLTVIRSRARVSTKMFAVVPKAIALKDSELSVAWRKILYLCFGRVSGLVPRVRIISSFISHLYVMKKRHGIQFTIKWLKCCYVALQKSLGKNPLTSLRDLEPDLPLPRLINGLPTFINKSDRKLIKEGHIGVIRFWSSLFSIYRVLKGPYSLKTKTITDKFIGDSEGLSLILEKASKRSLFESLPGFLEWSKNMRLAPRVFILSKAASPSNKVSWHGILTDVWNLMESELRWTVFGYLDLLKTNKHNTDRFYKRLEGAYVLADRLLSHPKALLPFKPSLAYGGNGLAQLALKEEAAGKLRVFALVDSVTQSILSPLHEELFKLLSIVPNDGTFDQEKSIDRSVQKSVEAGCAFSFDLSAATDRLPGSLSAQILSNLVGFDLGPLWLELLVEREYYLSHKSGGKYGLDKDIYLKYSVGQPMGALSSWAMLAVTHHYILQYCSKLILGNSYVKWEERYEILGDDLVIFDRELADKYLEVARILGVEINLNKSIYSPDVPVFEFAKRTFMNGKNVSPIPFKQILCTDLGSIVGNYLMWSRGNLLTIKSVLAASVSKRAITKFTLSKHGTPLLAILGVLTSLKYIPHRWLVESLIAPSEEFDFESAPLKLPLKGISEIVTSITQKIANRIEPEKVSESLSYPWSNEEIRKEIYLDYEPDFANVIADKALTIARSLENDYDALIADDAAHWFIINDKPTTDIPLIKSVFSDDIGLWGALQGFFEENIIDFNKGLDPTDIVDEIETDPKFYYRRNLTIEHSESLLAKAERLYYKVVLKPAPKSSKEIETAGLILNLGKVVKGVRSNFYKINRPTL